LPAKSLSLTGKIDRQAGESKHRHIVSLNTGIMAGRPLFVYTNHISPKNVPAERRLYSLNS